MKGYLYRLLVFDSPSEAMAGNGKIVTEINIPNLSASLTSADIGAFHISANDAEVRYSNKFRDRFGRSMCEFIGRIEIDSNEAKMVENLLTSQTLVRETFKSLVERFRDNANSIDS